MNDSDYTECRKDHKMKITRKLTTLLVCMIFIFSIFQNVSAVDRIYTIEDNNSNVTINSGEMFNVSLLVQSLYIWEIDSYDSSIVKFVDMDGWVFYPELPGSRAMYNWTFEGKHEGNTTLKFTYGPGWAGNDTIIKTFALNVTVNAENSIKIIWSTIVAISIIIIVSTAIIIKRVKGGGNE